MRMKEGAMESNQGRPCETRTHTARQAIALDLGIPLDEIRPEARIRQDLGMDTFDLQELLGALEDEFEVAFPEGEEKTLRTVADIECVVRDAQAAH
jgi:acyl carrier protein